MQVPYLREIKKLGFTIVATDMNPEAPGRKLADRFYPVSYEDKDELIEIGKKEGFSREDRVFTAASQFAHIGAAHFASYFGINYIPRRTVQICLDKFLFYKTLEENIIPFPKTYYCFSRDDIERIIKENRNVSENWYIKSDYGKSPWYVYHVKNLKLPDISFKKDRYLRKGYVVQEEILGRHVRVVFFSDQFIYFIHQMGKMFFCTNFLDFFQVRIEEKLRNLIEKLKLKDRFVKFDLILNKQKYFVLDIGIDPPQRLRVLCNYLKWNFFKNYSLYCLGLGGKFPSIQELVSSKVLVSARKIKRLS